MQPSFLEEFSVFTSYRILESEEECISFLQNHEIIPKKEDEPPPCPACSSRMSAYNNKELKIGWRWFCKQRKTCNASLNALKHTFFEDLKAPFRNVMAVIFGLIMNIDKTYLSDQMMNWRTVPIERSISIEKVEQLYNALVEVVDSALRENGVNVTGTEDEIFEYYRETKLNSLQTWDDKLLRFLMDIKAVYPGYLKIILNRQ